VPERRSSTPSPARCISRPDVHPSAIVAAVRQLVSQLGSVPSKLPPKERDMQIDKQTVIDLIRQHGNAGQADQASQQLPDQVDTDQQSGLLQGFGLDPATISQHLPGGLKNL
jgi:hypothetical protein